MAGASMCRPASGTWWASTWRPPTDPSEKIDEATYDVGSSFVVVDTGPWIFGSKVMLPAGTINRVDRDARKVYVCRSKDEIKSAPKFDEHAYRDRAYQDRLGGYYRKFRY
jgi:hypothetical protein